MESLVSIGNKIHSGSQRAQMQRRGTQRLRYVHKRQASSVNETSIIGASKKETTSATATATTSLALGQPITSSVIVSSIASSSTSLSGVSLSSSSLSTITATVTTPSSTVVKPLSTAIISTTSRHNPSTSNPTHPIVIPTANKLLASTPGSSNLPSSLSIASTPTPAPTVAPPAATILSSIESISSSVHLGTSTGHAPSTFTPAPTFAPIPASQLGVEGLSTILLQQTTPTVIESSLSTRAPTNSNTLLVPTIADATSGPVPLPTDAGTGGQQSNSLANTIMPSINQGSNNTAIIGAVAGSIACLFILAIVVIFCIRRRHKKNTKLILSPFIKPPSSRERMPISPSPTTEHFRPDVKTLFHSERLSSISEQNTRSSTPSGSPPPYRHSRSYTTTFLPVLPFQSTVRPPSGPPSSDPALSHSRPTDSIDTSFMGTISTYLSSSNVFNSGNNLAQSDSLAPNPQSRHISSTNSQYSTSPHTSYVPPSTQTTTHTAASLAPPTRSSKFTSLNPTTPLIQSPPPLTRNSTSRGGRPASRFQSVGPWRDSMWSTSTTPTSTTSGSGYSSTSSGASSMYFPRPPSNHRASRSLADLPAWNLHEMPLPPLRVSAADARGAWPLRDR